MKPIDKQQKLREELIKLYDTGKSRILKKYNLSIYDIHTIQRILNGDFRDFINETVANCLKDYGYSVTEYEIGFRVWD